MNILLIFSFEQQRSSSRRCSLAALLMKLLPVSCAACQNVALIQVLMIPNMVKGKVSGLCCVPFESGQSSCSMFDKSKAFVFNHGW